MSVSYQKVKSSSKTITPKGKELTKKVLDTLGVMSDIVGATLGPGGSAVLIERQEYGLANMVTKDGVTVAKNLGFMDPTAHSIMEAARDAATRTATEAGDGTTTATVLAEAIVRKTNEFCTKNPKVSPQKVVRKIENEFRKTIEPTIQKLAIKADLESDSGRKLLHSVATISANGDSDLATAVLECYDLVGDAGNVTILEVNGPSSYEVEKIEGYPVSMGYEDSCGKYYPQFINEAATAQTKLENPVFILFHGRVVDPMALLPVLQQLDAYYTSKEIPSKNVVLVATGYSDSVLGWLGMNFPMPDTFNVFPLLAPLSPQANGQLAFLEDLAARTGARIFDPVNRPFDGPNVDPKFFGYGVTLFEATRYRSNVLGFCDEMLIEERAAILKSQIENPESQLDAALLQERLGKLTGGIARLKVIGASSGELREKRDRAEDAVCAVRGALQHGCLPGGGWTLLYLAAELDLTDPILKEVLHPALRAPVQRLLDNCGFSDEEQLEIINKLDSSIHTDENYALTYDAMEHKFVEAKEGGILDSVPAVKEAIRNSFSIATLLGTLGGAVVFPRDIEFERREAAEAHSFLRNAGEANPADERW